MKHIMLFDRVLKTISAMANQLLEIYDRDGINIRFTKERIEGNYIIGDVLFKLKSKDDDLAEFYEELNLWNPYDYYVGISW